MADTIKVAYADPPYLGCSRRLYGHLHPNADDYDKPETHARLVQRLVDEYPDGWALSCNSKDLRWMLPLCPKKTRVMAWVKPYSSAAFPNADVVYAWEPVLVHGGRKSRHPADKPHDWVKCLPGGTTQRSRDKLGVTKGTKPETFCYWLFGVMGLRPGDQLDDLFHGSGSVARAWRSWCEMERAWGGHRVEREAQP